MLQDEETKVVTQTVENDQISTETPKILPVAWHEPARASVRRIIAAAVRAIVSSRGDGSILRALMYARMFMKAQASLDA